MERLRRLRSARSSAAVWQRMSRSFSRALLMISSSLGGSSGTRRMAAVGWRLRIASVIDGGSFSAEGQNAGGHFVEHDAEGKKIGAAVEFFAAQLLGRHVGHGADRGAGTGEIEAGGIGEGLRIAAGGAGGAGDLRQTEVENLGVAAVGDENVRGLDVAMDDSLAVRGIEGVGHFDRQGEQALELHRPALDQVLQGLAAEALHHDEEMAIVLADFVDGADVGMVQRRSGAGFAAEAFESLGILGSIVGKKLQGDEAAELRVFRFVNHSHAAAAEQFNDAVVGDGLADHVCRMMVERALACGGGTEAKFILGEWCGFVNLRGCLVVVQFDKEASQTLPSVAPALSGQAPWIRGARPDSLASSGQALRCAKNACSG